MVFLLRRVQRVQRVVDYPSGVKQGAGRSIMDCSWSHCATGFRGLKGWWFALTGVKRIERPAVWGRLSILFTFFIFCLSVSGWCGRGFLS